MEPAEEITKLYSTPNDVNGTRNNLGMTTMMKKEETTNKQKLESARKRSILGLSAGISLLLSGPECRKIVM